MSGFNLSDEARQDLFDIWKYIALDSLDAADKVREDFYEAIHLLVERPAIGHIREDLADTSLRFWRVHSYLIVYRPDPQPLEIVRILSGYRDMSRLL